MDTFNFENYVELQYFIEQVSHAGFIRDKRRSDGYATTYVHGGYPAYHIVLRSSALSADVYCNNKLLRYHHKNDYAESKLALQ